ncbi:hypothetical protein PLICRDRAFT_57290 [Plicaturopsis crispa FD-325 SS-3]|uniref:Uncharacterized protein n=1 Tax=Plicaturopsis crispa FD-325 SS-3 TaxID=944288 RepID=A0A0C9T634_PLICR|nr:hypothetical protein PLICRDRAFT_57290 [Plicaturopsis crispa FD-325 SS-3]
MSESATKEKAKPTKGHTDMSESATEEKAKPTKRHTDMSEPATKEKVKPTKRHTDMSESATKEKVKPTKRHGDMSKSATKEKVKPTVRQPPATTSSPLAINAIECITITGAHPDLLMHRVSPPTMEIKRPSSDLEALPAPLPPVVSTLPPPGNMHVRISLGKKLGSGGCSLVYTVKILGDFP